MPPLPSDVSDASSYMATTQVKRRWPRRGRHHTTPNLTRFQARRRLERERERSMASEEVRIGWYQVAVDSPLDFRVYPERDTAPGQKPWIERLQEATAAREPFTISFEGRSFTWHPGSDDFLPVVTVPINDWDNYDEERFAAALSFEFGFGVAVYSAIASGFNGELDPPLLQQARIKPTIYPAPNTVEVAETSDELSLCLALVREALSSASRVLAYLSYWKAVEVAVGDPDHRSWIGPAAVALWPEDGRTAESWYERLKETRIAAAHAIPRLAPQYHPDDPTLTSRLMEDVDRMHRLALKAIRERWQRPVRIPTRP